MKMLLDTHAFLWFIMGSESLSAQARAAIEDSSHQKLISMASLWEMAIKVSLGKLVLAEPFDALVPTQIALNGFEVLPIQIDHVTAVSTLPFHHRDPFDRLIVAQAVVEQIPIVTMDPAFRSYSVQTLW